MFCEWSYCLTNDSYIMYRSGRDCVPTGSTGHAPLANSSLGKETVLQGTGLARGEEHGHQLPLPLYAPIVGQGGSCPHCLDARNWCYGSTGTLFHLVHHVLKQGIQIGQGWTWKGAYTAGIQ